jgi:hypothetical protein
MLAESLLTCVLAPNVPAALWFREGVVTWSQCMTPWLKEEGRV